jgi:hypothetical protein
LTALIIKIFLPGHYRANWSIRITAIHAVFYFLAQAQANTSGQLIRKMPIDLCKKSVCFSKNTDIINNNAVLQIARQVSGQGIQRRRDCGRFCSGILNTTRLSDQLSGSRDTKQNFDD